MDVYIDGACSGNPGKAGWAYVICLEDTHVTDSGTIPGISTNNVAEATGLLKVLTSGLLNKNETISLYTDSQYVIRCIERLDKGLFPNSHPSLWSKIQQALHGFNLKPYHVRGHSGQPENTMCDKLARAATRK